MSKKKDAPLRHRLSATARRREAPYGLLSIPHARTWRRKRSGKPSWLSQRGRDANEPATLPAGTQNATPTHQNSPFGPPKASFTTSAEPGNGLVEPWARL